MASAFGGRMDISVANLSVMIRHHTTCNLSMVHGDVMARVVSDRATSVASISFEAQAGSSLSCIPLDGEAVVSLSNVKWPLSEATLRSGSHGVSNEALGGSITVHVHKGLVVVGYNVKVAS